MTKILPLALHATCAAALALITASASAQTPPPGRIAFDKSGCRTCHAYSSRRGAPSVRDMLASFEAEPENALKGIEQTRKHADDAASKAVSEQDRRLIAEWISGASLPEPEEVATAATAPALPAVVAPPAVRPTVVTPPPAPPRRPSNNLVGVVVEPAAKGDRLVITLSGKTPEDLDIGSVDGKLVIRLPGVGRAAGVPETIPPGASTRAVNTVQALEQDGTLTITVAAHQGDLKYAATQGRNRLSIDLTAVPARKASLPAVAAAPAKATVAAAAAVPAIKAPAAKGKTADKPAAEKALAKPAAGQKPDALAKLAPSEEIKAKQEAKVKQEADAKAKKEADALAQAKREADEKAAQVATKKEADDKAKREASAAAKAEAEMLAALTASAEAMKKGGDGEAKTRKDRSKLKAPEKFRDEPCPPIAETEPVGLVDEAKAKDIIERVGCPQCHAFVQKKTGPPFKRVFEKVKGNPSCVVARLKKNKEHREEGVTDDLKAPEFKIVADYLATRAK